MTKRVIEREQSIMGTIFFIFKVNTVDKQVGFFKKKPMKRSAAVCFKRFPFALDFSVVDPLVRH